MLFLQEQIRDLVNQDMDCSQPSYRLLAMRAEMVQLIAQRNAMGGAELCPNIAERLRADFRPLRRHAPDTEKPGQSRAPRSRAGSDRAQTARPIP